MKAKKIIFTLVMLLIPIFVLADGPLPTANIEVSPDWGKSQCASKPGKDITLVWGGVTDKRPNPVVGTLKKKKDEFEIRLAGSVDSVIGEAVKAVLTNCGFVVETKKDAKGIETSVEVSEFFAGAKKGFLTGETDAKGSLVIHFNNNGANYDFSLGAERSDKRLKKKDIKQLEDVLTGLLETVVTQIGESPALFAEVKKLSR